MTLTPGDLRQRLAELQARIDAAAARAGRDPAEISLVAVTKTFPPELIAAAYAAGLRHFGENRVEEAEEKIGPAQALIAAPPPTWHMIGHIQSRKAAEVARHFDWVHSVDRLKVARRLNDSAGALGRSLSVLLEVNLSGEESKSGFALAGWPGQGVEPFFAEVEAILSLPALKVRGLMTMAPYSEDPELARPVFRRCRELSAALRERFPAHPWDLLSMGMSGDFEVAIEEGSRIIRVGTALFGPRP